MFAPRSLAMAAAALAVVACASAPVDRADGDGVIACDANRMAQVERDARRTFKEVHWLHCPQARS